MENFEEILHKDLHQFLQSMNEVDERLPECPDVEDKWEEIAKAYIPDGIRELTRNGTSIPRSTTSMPTCETRGATIQWTNISVKMYFCCKVLTTPLWRS